MIIEQTKLDNGIAIATWDITESIDRLLEILDLDPYTIEEISRFSSEKRKLEFLAVRCALRHLSGRSLRIKYLPGGMPYLDDHSMQIGISHTGHYATVITHPTTPVSIDIERIGDKVIRVRHKFLHQEELQNIDPRSEKIHLTILWAAKEALYKIIGIETVDFINQLRIEPFQPYMYGTIAAQEYASEAKATYTLHYKVYPEYVVVWTTKQ